MNSYGESQSPRARASVPGPGGATPDDDRSSGAAKPPPDAYRRGAGGRASVGSASARASVGSASVGSASVGSASVGSASVGSASVGSASVGSASVGSARVGGRASVGSAGGSAAVARAAVRPVPAGGAPVGGAPGRPGAGDRAKIARKRRRTNILTAAAAVLVIMLGVGVVGGTYFFDSLDLPDINPEAQSNTIRFANGETIAKLGEQNRVVVPEGQILQYVKDAVAAAEDKNFYKHHGIDMKGIVRAAWNNFTGGGRQGASTITQQYARHAADLKAISINRKLREAVIARKLESRYSKNEIMGKYLNYVYLGEGRYGIEAAAQGYFGKSTIAKPGAKNAITVYEAAVLASIIKQPEPSDAHRGYNPNVNPVDAQARWEYTMANMLEMKWISKEQYDARKYPTPRKPSKNKTTTAVNKPVGMVLRHVRAELIAMGIKPEQIDQGGFKVTTTINPVVQAAAEEAGSRKSKESPLYGRPASYQAAVIGINPENGQVLGYYGGDDPTGTDYGGYLTDGERPKIDGGQSPGSTFKIYTLAAGLKEDISFKTTWNGKLLRPNGTKISNAGADPGTVCGGRIEYCDLETATIKSYNFPFYWIADKIGVDKVIKAARDAGVRHMWTSPPAGQDSQLIDLNTTDSNKWGRHFDREVAFGQYRVVPLEHAEGVATIVGGGVHHDAHFIKEVQWTNPETGATKVIAREKIKGKQVFPEDQMSNLQGAMKLVNRDQGRQLRNGREAISKSGTWEFGKGNGDTWYVGGIPQLAATVWVGGAGNKVQLKESGGGKMYGSGTPSRIWRQFLNTVTRELDMEKKDFPQRIDTGNPNSEYANGKPPPVQTQPDGNCLLGFVGSGCENNGGNNNGGGNGGPGGNNGPGGGNGGPGGGNGGPGGNFDGGAPPPQPTAPVENGDDGQ